MNDMMRSPNMTLKTLLLPLLLAPTLLLIGCGGTDDATPATSDTSASAPLEPRPTSENTGASEPRTLGQDQSQPTAGSPRSVFDPPPVDSGVERAQEVLIEVGRVYREAPTLTDELQLSLRDEPPQSMHLRFGRNNERIQMALPTQIATYIDGTLYMTNESMYDTYLELENVEDPAMAIVENFNWVPPYHFAMRTSGTLEDAAAVEFYLSGLGLGILRNPRIRGYATYTDDDGRQFHRVTIASPTGEGHVYIDMETMLVERMEIQILPMPGQPADVPPMQMDVTANPVIADELAEPVVFEPGDRERVTEPQAMTLRPLVPGDRAPDLRFETQDGRRIRLSELRGQVVVVDFWATWCIPCIQGLPHLDRFAKWVAEENKPVQVFAVNTLEQHESLEARREAAQAFWEERGFAMPLVYDDAEHHAVKRTGYNNIPLLLVIDTKGRIQRVKNEYDRNMYQILKAEVDRALQNADDDAGSE